MKMFFLALLFINFNLLAQEEKITDSSYFKIFVDCYSPDNLVDCLNFEEVLKTNLKYQDRVVNTLEDSSIKMELRTRRVDIDGNPGSEVTFKFFIKNDTTPIAFFPVEYVLATVNQSTVVDIANHAVLFLVTQRGIAAITVDESSGKVSTTFNKPATNPGDEPADDIKPWYIVPSFYAHLNNSKGQNQSSNLGFGADYVRSKPKFKYRVGISGNSYKQKIIFDDGTSDEYEEVSLGLSTLYVRSLKNNHWSLALITHVGHNPVEENIDYSISVNAGIEYTLVPFIVKSEDQLISIRYIIGQKFYNLNDPNQFDQTIINLIQHGIELGGRFNFSRFNNNNQLTLNVGLGANSEIDSFQYANLDFHTSIDYGVSKRVIIEPSYSFSLHKDFPNQRKQGDDGGVIGDVQNAGQFANFQQYLNVSLKFILGSTESRTRDNRWH